MLHDERFRPHLSEYDALVIVEWELLLTTDTSLENIYRAAFGTNTESLATEPYVDGIAIDNNTGHPSTEYALITCGGERHSCGVVARTLLNLDVQSLQPSQEGNVSTAEGCVDFAMGGHPGLPWTFEDCMDVWGKFVLSVPFAMKPRIPYVDFWKGTAAELRRAGSPCLVAPPPVGDGLGSSTIRHLHAWIFSEQMGCDWATPAWGRGFQMEDGSTVYCHAVKGGPSKDREQKQAMNHCSVANWLSYFQFDVPSVAIPRNETLKYIEVRAN